MQEFSKGRLDLLRQQYPEGSRIRLWEMGNDPNPVPPGSMGTLQFIDDMGTFHTTFDNGRRLGLIPGEDSFTVLPPIQTLKLFMPLTAHYYRGDEWGDMSDEVDFLDGCSLYDEGYEDCILASLLKERAPEEAERGLMLYYREEDGVSSKVQSYFFTVEERDRQLWGVAECRVQGQLTLEELDAFKETVTGQASDGLGEGWEQRPIQVGDGELYVHLWQDSGWSIMTEQDRFDPHFSERLPDMCCSILPSDGSLIRIKRGESGYSLSEWNREDPEKNRRLADYFNAKRGISKAQEQAMSFGSMFGWDKPGADPKVYMRQQEQGGMDLV